MHNSSSGGLILLLAIAAMMLQAIAVAAAVVIPVVILWAILWHFGAFKDDKQKQELPDQKHADKDAGEATQKNTEENAAESIQKETNEDASQSTQQEAEGNSASHEIADGVNAECAPYPCNEPGGGIFLADYPKSEREAFELFAECFKRLKDDAERQSDETKELLHECLKQSRLGVRLYRNYDAAEITIATPKLPGMRYEPTHYKGIFEPLAQYLAFMNRVVYGDIYVGRRLIETYCKRSLEDDSLTDFCHLQQKLFQYNYKYINHMAKPVQVRADDIGVGGLEKLLELMPEFASQMDATWFRQQNLMASVPKADAYKRRLWELSEGTSREISTENFNASAASSASAAAIAASAAFHGCPIGDDELMPPSMQPAHPMENPRTVDDIVYVDGRYIENENSEAQDEWEYEEWRRRRLQNYDYGESRSWNSGYYDSDIYDDDLRGELEDEYGDDYEDALEDMDEEYRS